jgi:hypothetical protein
MCNQTTAKTSVSLTQNCCSVNDFSGDLKAVLCIRIMLMRIRIRLITADADPDYDFLFDADPDADARDNQIPYCSLQKGR